MIKKTQYKCQAWNCPANCHGLCYSGDAHLQFSCDNDKKVTTCQYCLERTGNRYPSRNLVFSPRYQHDYFK